MWRLRAISYDLLIPSFRANPDATRRLGLWRDELQQLAARFHVRFSEDPDQRQKKIEENRRIDNRSDELRVMQGLLLRNPQLAIDTFNELMRNTTDPTLPTGEDPYELDVAHYRALRLGAELISLNLGVPVTIASPSELIALFNQVIDDIFRKAPSDNQAVNDLLETTSIAISDDQELKELQVVSSFFLKKMEEGTKTLGTTRPRQRKGIENKLFSLLYGVLACVQKMIEVQKRRLWHQNQINKIRALASVEKELLLYHAQIAELQHSIGSNRAQSFRRVVLDIIQLMGIKVPLAMGHFEEAYFQAEAYLDRLHATPTAHSPAEFYEGFLLIAEALEGLGKKTEAQMARDRAGEFAKLAQSSGGQA